MNKLKYIKQGSIKDWNIFHHATIYNVLYQIWVVANYNVDEEDIVVDVNDSLASLNREMSHLRGLVQNQTTKWQWN